MMRDVYVVGVGMHEFGRFPDRTAYEIGAVAVRRALGDAGLEFGRIEAAYCGHMYARTGAGFRALSLVGLTGLPIVNVENACSSGGSVFRLAYQAVATGLYECVLAFGLEKMPKGFMDMDYYDDWRRRAGQAANPIYFALAIRRHMAEHGTTERHLALVSVKNHRHAVHFPYALYRKALSVEEVLASPLVCDPLRLLMLCVPDEGGAAAVLASAEVARRLGRATVRVAAAELTTPLTGQVVGASLPASGSARLGAEPEAVRAARLAYERAGLGPEDVDVVECQDTDAGTELMTYEHLGLCKPGEGGRLIEEGQTAIGGRIPVNPSGGLLSRGEPVGASGLAQVAEITWQLRGVAGPRQVAGARVGLTHTLGAGGNCAVTILTR